MRANSTFALLNTFLLFLFLSNPIQAKKVVCIDDGGDDGTDTFLSAHEGWERQNADDDTVIQVGGSLTDCLAQLEDGDQLVIVAHGFNGGEGFNWGNSSYTGFGDGEGEMPVPDGFDELDNITVDFCTCWSGTDPDGADGEDTSLCSKIEEALGDGTTSNGFTDLATATVCFTIKPVEGSGVTDADVKAATDCLNKDSSWSGNPPHNRDPAPATTDKSAAQAQVDGKVGAGKVQVCLEYYKPKNTTDEDATAEEDEAGESGGIGGTGYYVGDCGCGGTAGGDCGLTFIMNDDNNGAPDILVPSPLAIPDGVWINPTPWVFLNPDPGNPEVLTLRNVRMYNIQPQIPLSDIGGGFVVDSFFDVFFDVYVGDTQVGDEVPGVGSMQVMILPMPYSDPAETEYYQTEILSMNLTGESPLGPLQLDLNPAGGPGGGAMTSTLTPQGNFNVDSFFDVFYHVTIDAATALSCGEAALVYVCSAPSDGCTDQDSPNFSPCAVFDDGSCSGSATGCTYPGACNYNPQATIEDGSCMFVGCTDPAANNYNPLATHDNGSCSYAAAVACPGDMNGDGVRDTLDLLAFLGVYNVPCE